MNKHCYKFKELNFDQGFFDKFVDVTYIITMEKSKRHKHINEQLKQYKPTSKIIVVYNKGFKNCNKKNLLEQKACNDLLDCYYNVFLHSDKSNYNNILILEDDFIFNDNIKDKNIINQIKNVFFADKNIIFHYSLGSMPYLILPYDRNTNYTLSMGSHAIIYPKKTIQYIIKLIKNMYQYNIFIDYDILLNLFSYRMNYKKPLCVQTVPVTENSKTWPKIGQFYMKMLRLLLKIDKKEYVFNAYKKIYIFNKIIFIISLIILYIIIYILLKKFN